MEFTVAEQLALLAIRPGGGWAIGEGRLETLLAAGLIGELVVNDEIHVDDGVVQTLATARSALLEDVQAKIAGLPIDNNQVLAASGGKTTLKAVYRRLADRSLVEQETGWFRRWRFTTQGEDATPADELAVALRDGLVAAELSPRDRMAAQLLDAARLLGWLKIPRAELDGARESLRPRPWIAEALQRRLATQSFRV